LVIGAEADGGSEEKLELEDESGVGLVDDEIRGESGAGAAGERGREVGRNQTSTTTASSSAVYKARRFTDAIRFGVDEAHSYA
jgi:hypothetical protein